MRVSVLASGSNGNATFIETNNLKFLIDDGISFKSLLERLHKCQLGIDDVDSIFLTHEHYDHVCGLKMLFKRRKMDCYISKGTYCGLNEETKSFIMEENLKYIQKGDVLIFGDCKITILATHHDAKEPIGLVVEENDKKLVYITDTGFVEQKYFELLKNADMYIIESNYDVELLWSSGRPFELKKRIDGDYGHMSNEASAILMAKLIGEKTKTIILAHISDDCNYYHMPNFIKNVHTKIYKEYNIDYGNINILCANRSGVTGVFEL